MFWMRNKENNFPIVTHFYLEACVSNFMGNSISTERVNLNHLPADIRNSEYDQEIPQSQTADKHMTP